MFAYWGSPYKTVRANNSNELHAIPFGSRWRKIRRLQSNHAAISKPASFYRDYPTSEPGVPTNVQAQVKQPDEPTKQKGPGKWIAGNFSLGWDIVRKYVRRLSGYGRVYPKRAMNELQIIYGKLWKPIACWGALLLLSALVLGRSKTGAAWYYLSASFFLGLSVCAILYYPFHFFNPNWGSMHYQALCLAYAGLVTFAIFSALHLKTLFKEPQTWDVVAFLGLAWAVVHMASHSVASTVSVLKGVFGLASVLLISGVAVYRWLDHRGNGWRMAPLYAGVLVFFFCGLHLYWGQIAGGRSGDALAATFQQGKLAGIKAHPNTVRHLEDLLVYLKDKVNPGDFLLCYYHIPPVNYLTETRPAINSSWFWPKYGVYTRKKLLREMIDAGRVPEYAVKAHISPLYPSLPSAPDEIAAPLRGGYFKPFPWLQPINAFVDANYVKVKTIGPYEVWKRTAALLRPSKTFLNPNVVCNKSNSLPMRVLNMTGKFQSRKKDDFTLVCPAKGGSRINPSIRMGCPLPLPAVRGKEVFGLMNAHIFSGSKCTIRLLESLPMGEKMQSALPIIPGEPYEDHHVSLRISPDARRVLFVVDFAAGKNNRCLWFKAPSFFVVDR